MRLRIYIQRITKMMKSLESNCRILQGPISWMKFSRDSFQEYPWHEPRLLCELAWKPKRKVKRTLDSASESKKMFRCSKYVGAYERRLLLYICNCMWQMRHLQCVNVGLMSQNSLRLHSEYFRGSEHSLLMAFGHVHEPAAFQKCTAISCSQI